MNVVITTATFFPSESKSSEVRAKLALEMMLKVKKMQIPLVVVEGGSSEEFLAELRNNGIEYILQKKPGLGAGKQEAVAEASKRGDIIFLTEAEKVSLMDFIDVLVEPIKSGKADMIVPKRKSMADYPFFQQKSEELLNLFWKNCTSADLDLAIGPRLFTKEMGAYFLNYDLSFGDRWEAIFLPLIDAIKDKKRILSVEVDYTHPLEQTKSEEGDIQFDLKRIDQLNSLCTSIHAYWNK